MTGGAASCMERAGVPVSSAAWLDAWEAAQACPPGRREAALLAPACGCSEAELARLPLGQRDRLLLDLRRVLFGAPMACTASCPACHERCEWSCDAQALRMPEPDPAEATGAAPRAWTHGAWSLAWRPADGDDLAAAANCADEDEARRRLLARLVSGVQHDGRPAEVAALPAEVVDALDAAMAEADPQAALTMALACPACGHAWVAPLDLGAFVWAEFDAWAQRTLLEVHQLALRYGWSEPEVLALPPARRARYLAIGES